MEAKDVKQLEYIDLFTRNAIQSILQFIHKNKTELRLWQKTEPNRAQARAGISKIDTMNSLVTIQVLKDENFENFEENKTLYFHSEYRNLVLKCTIKSIGKKSIVITFPEVAKIEEARLEDRKKFGLRSFQRIDLLIVCKNGKRVMVPELNLVDCSDHGLAFLIPKIKASNIYLGAKIIVMMATVEKLQNRVGSIKSVINFKNILTGEATFRVGIQLSDTVVDEI